MYLANDLFDSGSSTNRTDRKLLRAIFAVEMQRPTQQRENALHSDEMRHFLLGDGQDDLRKLKRSVAVAHAKIPSLARLVLRQLIC
jgi:hypothetical protein